MERKSLKRYPTCHGFGAIYYHGPKEYKGAVYSGEWKNGRRRGSGKEFWLESAPSWKNNRLDGSAIEENGNGRPYVYSGKYINNWKEDESAIITLKDGTTRAGACYGGRPVGDWRKDHKLVTAATTTEQPNLSASVVKSEEPTTTLTASTRASRSSPAKQPLQRKPPPQDAVLGERKPSAQPAQGAKNVVTTSAKPPQIISLNNSDDNDTSDQSDGTAANAAALPDADVPSQGQASDEKVERVKEISEWLVKIGFRPLQEEMEAYASKFIVLGLHSDEMIVNVCTKEDIAGFDWINPFHKRWITAALRQD